MIKFRYSRTNSFFRVFTAVFFMATVLLCFAHCKNDDNGNGDNTSPTPTPAPGPGPAPDPEPTCTPGDTEILNAELTVEHCSAGGSTDIYGLSDAVSGACTGSLGSITEADFNTLDGSSYTIENLVFYTVSSTSGIEFDLVGDVQISPLSTANKLTLGLLKNGVIPSATRFPLEELGMVMVMPGVLLA